jgi:type II secretory pathway pseudopilin PulG
MKGGTGSSQGFTIVETLLVLAVTSFMFVTATVYISGRQGKAQFLDAIQDTRSQIQATMTEVVNGVYPSTTNFTCRNNTAAGKIRIDPAGGAVNQGVNEDCVFLGKTLSFGVGGNTSAMRVDTVAMRRTSSTGEVSLLTRPAGAMIINGTNDANNTNPNLVDIGTPSTLKNGLEVVWMRANGAGGTPLAGIVIATSPSFGQTTYIAGTSSMLASGSLIATVTGIPNNLTGITGAPATPAPLAGGGVSKQTFYTLVHATIGTPTIDVRTARPDIYNSNGGLQICFASGTTNQSGLITIGSASRGLYADLTIKNGTTCA